MNPVQGKTIHREIRLVLNHLWASESVTNYHIEGALGLVPDYATILHADAPPGPLHHPLIMSSNKKCHLVCTIESTEVAHQLLHAL